MSKSSGGDSELFAENFHTIFIEDDILTPFLFLFDPLQTGQFRQLHSIKPSSCLGLAGRS
jgi:hypothetical protein